MIFDKPVPWFFYPEVFVGEVSGAQCPYFSNQTTGVSLLGGQCHGTGLTMCIISIKYSDYYPAKEQYIRIY
jgi:hypothetical protein